MEKHVCARSDEISVMGADIKNLKEYTNDDKAWKTRMEEKVDKILWFFLGQALGVITVVIGGVILYVITK